MATAKVKTIELIDIHTHKNKSGYEVCDNGIYLFLGNTGKLVIPRDIFVEAYNKYIASEHIDV